MIIKGIQHLMCLNIGIKRLGMKNNPIYVVISDVILFRYHVHSRTTPPS